MPECFEVEDLLAYERILEISDSRQTEMAACTVEQVDRQKDTYRSAIWCYPTSGGAPVKLTARTSVKNSPDWSPDGRQLAFVPACESGTRQVFLICREGGERRQLTPERKRCVACPVTDQSAACRDRLRIGRTGFIEWRSHQGDRWRA
jgi:dipeptidyl aminopeptidase/acylaminoacyl peptidase